MMKKQIKKITVIFALLLAFFISFHPVLAQDNGESGEMEEQKYEAKITKIEEVDCPEYLQGEECQNFELEVQDGDKQGETIKVEANTRDDGLVFKQGYSVGNYVFVSAAQYQDQTTYFITGPKRDGSILLLAVIFFVIVVAIGGLQGLGSFAGLAISFAILFLVMIPMMLNGVNPILAAVIGAMLVLVISIYLSHGFNAKTTTALIGTGLSLIITAVLSVVFIYVAKLSGFGSEDAFFLMQKVGKDIDMRGVLLASMIIGGIGVLDDVTVSQASVIYELKAVDPQLTWKDLFLRSMKVGRDHIASMVNTLVIAYAGASLPLVMLFKATNATLLEVVNYETLTEEIVRTLVGSIGLVLAVPLTSLIAAVLVNRRKENGMTAR